MCAYPSVDNLRRKEEEEEGKKNKVLFFLFLDEYVSKDRFESYQE